MIRALIVDDEPPARRHVRGMLESWPEIAIVGEAVKGTDAVMMIEELHPDLVFLDVQMPEMTGFDVIDHVGIEAMPTVVFVTAYDSYAVQAFEARALDYLLKPFDDRRFDAVLERAIRHVNLTSQAGHLKNLVPPLSKLIARSHGRMRVVELEDIDWLSVAGDYVAAHLGKREVLLDGSLAALESKLPADQFARIHRTLIVRFDRIEEIVGNGHGDGRVKLRCGTSLKLSRRYRGNLTTRLAAPPFAGR